MQGWGEMNYQLRAKRGSTHPQEQPVMQQNLELGPNILCFKKGEWEVGWGEPWKFLG